MAESGSPDRTQGLDLMTGLQSLVVQGGSTMTSGCLMLVSMSQCGWVLVSNQLLHGP